MINVKLYSNTNELQRHEAQMCLEEFGKQIKWKKHSDKTIDIGCGDGGVLMDIIKEYIPDNYEAIVGCDIDEESVRHANDRYNDERIKFIILNIESDIPQTLLKNFDHVFSFNVIHWIKDQGRAFQNMYNLLEEGGDILLMFFGYLTIFEFFEEASKIEKWAKYLGNVNKYISPYHNSLNPEGEVKNIMSQVGFKNIKVKCEMKCYRFKDSKCMKQSFLAMNPFKVPEEIYDEFIESLFDLYCKIVNKNKTEAEYENLVKYNLITVYGTK